MWSIVIFKICDEFYVELSAEFNVRYVMNEIFSTNEYLVAFVA